MAFQSQVHLFCFLPSNDLLALSCYHGSTEPHPGGRGFDLLPQGQVASRLRQPVLLLKQQSQSRPRWGLFFTGLGASEQLAILWGRNEVPTPFCGLALSFVSWYHRACSYSSGPCRCQVPASEPCLYISSLFIFQTTELKKSTLLCMPEVDTDIQKHTRAPDPNQGSARKPGWSHLKFPVLICSLFLKPVNKNLTSFSFETRPQAPATFKLSFLCAKLSSWCHQLYSSTLISILLSKEENSPRMELDCALRSKELALVFDFARVGDEFIEFWKHLLLCNICVVKKNICVVMERWLSG